MMFLALPAEVWTAVTHLLVALIGWLIPGPIKPRSTSSSPSSNGTNPFKD